MNTELAEKVLDHVLLYPEQHDQDVYGGKNSCGTTGCIAGWSMLLSGYTHIMEVFYRPNGFSVFEPFHEGQKLLGLNDEEARTVFYTFDNASAIKRLQELVFQYQQQG